ncbi:MAG: hypothetical protein C5B57_10845 [Blastocatellia bacterium]|nr:MAG: hypothetical protein C5B57_10845 [Blastocatellia bacterium]
MLNRNAATLALIGALTLTVGVLAQKKDDKKQTDEQKKEIQAVVKSVDDVAAGQPTPNDIDVTWVHEDYMKAQGNKQYAPFTVTIDPTKAGSGPVTFYWRVVSKDAASPPPPAESKDNKKDDKDKKNQGKRPEFAYEDVSFIPVAGQSAPMRITRSLTVPAGSYDVYVAVKEPASPQKNGPAPKTSVIKQSLTVPDFWNSELNTSSVIVAQRIDPLPAPLTPQQQVERPYALGGLEIVPVTDMKLPKKSELQTFMIIYNPKSDSSNKPDVIVEYNFYTKSGGAEKFFNKTTPQNLNGQTLPPQFDIQAGHQLQAGQAVPLTSFPEGDYRLEIKVTDKLANKSLTRDVNFTVSGS